MCIIAVKTKPGVLTTVERDWLWNCFIRNDDGAGFSYQTDKGIQIVKGLMSWEDFEKSIDEHDVGSKDQVIFHFRIGTHGFISPANTHPFPLSNKEEDLISTNIVTNVAIAHNGVLSDVPTYRLEEYSDTHLFIKDYLSGFTEEVVKSDAMRKLLGLMSKFAVMTQSGVYMTGGFTEEKGTGWLFSNQGYKYTSYKEPASIPTQDLAKVCEICGDKPKAFSKSLEMVVCNNCIKMLDIDDTVPYVQAGRYDDDQGDYESWLLDHWGTQTPKKSALPVVKGTVGKLSTVRGRITSKDVNKKYVMFTDTDNYAYLVWMKEDTKLPGVLDDIKVGMEVIITYEYESEWHRVAKAISPVEEIPQSVDDDGDMSEFELVGNVTEVFTSTEETSYFMLQTYGEDKPLRMKLFFPEVVGPLMVGSRVEVVGFCIDKTYYAEEVTNIDDVNGMEDLDTVEVRLAASLD